MRAALTAAVVVVAVCWLVGHVLLVIGAGVLAAVALGSFTSWLTEHGVARRGVALALVLASIVVVVGATGWLLAPEISEQTDQLVQQVPQAWQSLLEKMRHYEWGRALATPQASESLAVVTNATGAVASIFAAIGELAIVAFIGVYLAVDPEPYRHGILRLLRRARAPPRGEQA